MKLFKFSLYILLVRLKGIEPLAHSLEGCCSIHLSYRRITNNFAPLKITD